MKKDGKLFGKISIIDLLVLVLVVVLAVGVWVRFSGNSTGEVVSGATYECVVRVKNVRDFTVEALKKGGEVYDYETKEYIGTIVGVTAEPAADVLAMNDGTYDNVPMEKRHTAYVTISFTGKENADGYYNAANQQIGVGTTMNMNAKWAKCTGHVVSVGAAQ